MYKTTEFFHIMFVGSYCWLHIYERVRYVFTNKDILMHIKSSYLFFICITL